MYHLITAVLVAVAIVAYYFGFAGGSALLFIIAVACEIVAITRLGKRPVT